MSGEVKYRNVEVVQVADLCPDVSYLQQEGFKKRLAAFYRGEFNYIGIRAQCELLFPMQGDTFVVQKLVSPGIWNIEDDSGQDYLDEIAEDEKSTLSEMLRQLGVTEEAP